MNPDPETLVLGWGNPGRGDDGLGPESVQAIEKMDLPGLAVDSDYQLQVEDGAEVARYRRVVFVDADRCGVEPFRLGRLYPQDGGMSFSTHSVTPGAVLALARDLFKVEPEAWLLGICGYDFDEFDEQLSDRARSNMDQAVRYLQAVVLGDEWHEIPSRTAMQSTTNHHEGELCQTINP